MSNLISIAYIILGLLTLGWTCFVLVGALAALFSSGSTDNQTENNELNL